MSDDQEKQPDLSPANRIVGDINSPTVQARDVHGGVHVHHGGSPELHESPLVVSLESHSTSMVCTEPESRSASPWDFPFIPVSGSSVLKVLLEARSAQAVVLRALRVTILSRRPPLPVQSSTGIRGVVEVRPFTVDLDQEVPRVIAENIGFPLSVTASDPEMLAIRPVSTVDEVQWQLELDWTYAGRRGTTIIPEHGDGFRLYPSQRAR